MKKRHSIRILLAAAALLLATAACTKDELADGDRLPEGQYPLEIAAVTLSVEGGEAQPWGAPQTRVSENADGTGSVWEWDGSEMIGVQLGDKTTTYTLNTDHTLLADRQLYWTSTAPNQPVTAWYPATDGNLDLRDQDTNGLAYLLHGTGTGDHLTPVTLTFTHSLAKVRVTPTDDALGEVQSLQLYAYTQCTYEKGTVVQGSQEGWIKMKKCEYTENGVSFTCWEANVVPGYEIKKLRANGTEERELSSGITPVAGKFYNITLNKDLGYTEVSNGNYTVTSAEGLKNIAKLVNDGNTGIDITLTGNITLTGDWTPIGTSISNAYKGTFDGGGHTITGLTVTGSNEYAGLFGRIGSGGKVMNVKLEGVQIESDNEMSAVGGVVGYSYGNIENCSVSGSVSSNSTAGGVVGAQLGGSITGCNTSATVKGVAYAGGIAGFTNGGASLTGCYATGSVSVENNTTSAAYAGGVVGSNGASSTLTACYATGSVTGSGSGTIYTGGVTGTNDCGTLTACYHANGTVSGPDGTTGGVTGRNFKILTWDGAVITACYWRSNPDTGIGYNEGGSTTIETTKVTDGDWSGAKDDMNDALTAENESWRYQINLVNSLLELVQNQ